jgi:hypothetical protein
MTIQYVVGVKIAGNTFPLFDGTPDYFQTTPYIAVLQAYGIQNLSMQTNDFTGAYDILQAGSAGNTGTPCCNTYGVNGAQTDGACK